MADYRWVYDFMTGLVTKVRPEQYSLQVAAERLMEGGRLFHARAEATGKARSPSVE